MCWFGDESNLKVFTPNLLRLGLRIGCNGLNIWCILQIQGLCTSQISVLGWGQTFFLYPTDFVQPHSKKARAIRPASYWINCASAHSRRTSRGRRDPYLGWGHSIRTPRARRDPYLGWGHSRRTPRARRDPYLGWGHCYQRSTRRWGCCSSIGGSRTDTDTRRWRAELPTGRRSSGKSSADTADVDASRVLAVCRNHRRLEALSYRLTSPSICEKTHIWYLDIKVYDYLIFAQFIAITTWQSEHISMMFCIQIVV